MERLGVKFKVEKNKLKFSGRGVKPDLRKPEEMKQVVYDPDGLSSWKSAMYLMYRDVTKLAKQDIRLVFRQFGVRYDLTLIKPGFIGPEYNKTHGHFHPSSGRGRYYGEFYEVLSGKAMFLLQHRKLEDFIVMEAGRGQGIFIPGEYGHVTVNLGKKPLLLGNIVYGGFSSNYGPVRKKRGFAYYLFKDEIFVPNIRYPTHPTIILSYAEKIRRLDKFFMESPEEVTDVLLGK